MKYADYVKSLDLTKARGQSINDIRRAFQLQLEHEGIDYEQRDTFLGHLDLHTRRYRNGFVTLTITARPDPRYHRAEKKEGRTRGPRKARKRR